MKRITSLLATLLLLGSVAIAQNVGNCIYTPTLDTPRHRLDTLSITFSDYESIRLTSPEEALMFIYRTSLEEKYGEAHANARVLYGYQQHMHIQGNQLTVTPRRYYTSSGVATSLDQQAGPRRGWGASTDDYYRVTLPKGLLTARDRNGVEHVLDSISYQYVYSEDEDPDYVYHSPLEYRLTPADGTEHESLRAFTLCFPYCQGIFTYNYDQQQNPYILDAQGQRVTDCTRSFDYDHDNTGLILPQTAVTKSGVYTLVIPSASYHMSSSIEEWDDSLKHPEIRATYRVQGTEAMAWESTPAHQSTVDHFEGIFLTFPGKTIASKSNNIGGGMLRVYDKSNDQYPAMEFNYYFAKTEGNTISFTTASQISKVCDMTTYYMDVPNGLVTFTDGTTNDAMHIKFTYDTDAQRQPTFIDGQCYVGYTTGAVYRRDGVRFNSGAEQGMLIRLPREKTALLAGAHITAIRTATGTTQMDNPRLVIIEGEDVNATPVVEQPCGKFATTMKDYALDTPYEISGDKALYVGIKCSLSASYYPMLFDETLDLPEGLAWALTDNGWQDISAKGYGAPNIQLVVDRNAVEADLLVKPFHTSIYNKVGSPMSIATQIYNYGMQVVNSFDLTYKIGNSKDVTLHLSDLALAHGDVYDLSIDDAVINSAGRLPLRIQVTNVNGTKDIDWHDNLQTSRAYVYPKDMTRKVLFEEFTGQACVNCPDGMATVGEVLADYPDQYVEVYHHAGYTPDNFTLSEDYEYTWFYNNGGNTYAPGGMVNRRPAAAGATSVVFQSNIKGDVAAAVSSALQTAPYVGINLDNTYDTATRTGQVTIDVRCYEVPSSATHTLNVWLVQDSISRYQKGMGLTAHNHAMRMSLTGVWGHEISLEEGNTQSITLDYTIPQVIEGQLASYVLGKYTEGVDDKEIVAMPHNMRIVAFVSDLTDSPLSCTVWNVDECKVTDEVPTGIGRIESSTTENAIYDLQGRRVQHMQRGLYITQGKTILQR